MRVAVRYALRSLRRRPGTSLSAVVVLALGIGASTAISSVVHRLLLRPIPARGLDALVVAWQTEPSEPGSLVEVSLPYFEELRDRTRSFESLAAFGSVNWPHVFAGPGRPESVPAAYVSASFFETLGVRPLLGRTLLAADEQPGADTVLVLSYGLWQRRYAGEPSVVGTTLPTGEAVVGVMPRDFDFPQGATLWRPVAPALEEARASNGLPSLRGLGVLYLLGRLAPGASLEEARAEMGGLTRELSVADAFSAEGWRAELVPVVDHHLGANTRAALEALAAGGVVLLLLACANAALLLLGMAMAQRSDIGVRRALGATTARLVGGEAAKSLTVVSAATIAGGVVAWAALRGVVAFGPAGVPGLRELHLDTATLGLGVLVALLAALVVTSGPAWYMSRLPVTPTLRASGGASPDRRAGRLGALVVSTEVALALVLLVGSALLLRSLNELLKVELGFVPRNALSFAVERWDAEQKPLQEAAFVRSLVERLDGLPGVEAAGAVHLRPLEHGPIGSGAMVLPEGAPLDRASARDHSVNADWQAATPGYFQAVGTRLVSGRALSDRDTADAPKVVVVSEGLARRLWPGEEPVGRRVHTYGARARLEDDRFVDVEWMTVVGVVEEARYRGVQRPRPSVYLSYLQAPSVPGHFVIRTSGDPLGAVPGIRDQVRSLDPGARVGGVVTLEALVGRALAPWRFASGLLSAFAAVAVLLTASGLVGVLHRFVAQHRREIAIRMAVGATAGQVAVRVAAKGLAMTSLGLATGLLVSLALARSLGALLYGVGPYDPLALAGGATVVALVAAAACWLPARAAAGTDPVAVLRSE